MRLSTYASFCSERCAFHASTNAIIANLATDTSKASCSDGITSVDSAATAGRAFESTYRVIVQNKNSYWPFSVTYDFGEAIVINTYGITASSQNNYYNIRGPGEWTLHGSNDGENWTLLDARRNVIWSGDTQITRAFAFENSTAYRYYRFKGISTSDTGYFEMVQLEYFGPVPGELHLDVPAGKTLINDEVKFVGYMKFVKEGEGVYIGRNQSQSFSGGTLVSAGKAQPGVGEAANASHGYLNRKPFGFGGVTVAQGATFDFRSNYDYVYQEFTLDGGTLTSTGVDMTRPAWTGPGIRRLTADSDMDVENTLVFGPVDMDLGGNTLSIDITPAKTLYLRGNAITNGTIDITSGGWLNINYATDARTVDFKVGCALNVGVALSVHDYEAAYDYNANAGTAALNVYGAFKPTVAYFYGPTMQDGSTLDLSAWPGGWPLASSFTAGNTAISFAEGATVKVKFGARPVGSMGGKKVLGWTTAPANVNFLCADGERFGLRKKDDGLYIYRGMIILVK